MMINMIITFRHERFGCVRACRIDQKPWFVAEDILKMLGYRDRLGETLQKLRNQKDHYPSCEGYLPTEVNEFKKETSKTLFLSTTAVLRLSRFFLVTGSPDFNDWLYDAILPVLESALYLERSAILARAPYFYGPEPELYNRSDYEIHPPGDA